MGISDKKRLQMNLKRGITVLFYEQLKHPLIKGCLKEIH